MRQIKAPKCAACAAPTRMSLLRRLAAIVRDEPAVRAPDVADVADVAWLDRAFDGLAASEQHVLEMRYLAQLDDREIGHTLGIDATRANAIHEGALATLRRLRRHRISPAASR